MSKKRTPYSRKGIEITNEIREVYENRDKCLADNPRSHPLPPEKWANAMRRDELLRPFEKNTSDPSVYQPIVDALNAWNDGKRR